MPPRSVLTRIGWSAGSYAVLQVLRFATNVVLTRLLAPQIFGLLTIITTLRTGMELLTDIGINQNVISSRNGDDQKFLDTAWTIQVLRGPILAVLFVLASWPLSTLYKEPDIRSMLQVTSLLMILSGFMSVQRWSAQRHQMLKKIAKYDLAGAIFNGMVSIGMASVWPSAWAIVWAMVMSTFFNSLTSYFMFPGRRPRFLLDRIFAIEILSFGKWIFVSSIFYFIATNFDRLYLGAVIPLAALGVYGVARSLSEIIGTLVVYVGNWVVFPTVAAARDDLSVLRAKLRRSRTPLLMAGVVGLAGLASVSDFIVELIYDSRYHAAGMILPALVIGVWFTILTVMAEAVLLGVGKPKYGTIASFAKLIWLLIALPIGIGKAGLAGAVAATALADFVRYIPVVWAQRREGLSFLGFDLLMTFALIALVLVFRELTGMIGLTGGVSEWLFLLQGLLQ